MPLTATRRVEIAFGAGLLGLVVLGGIAGEGLLRVREALRVDWAALNETIMYTDADHGFARFKPGASFENISVNALGLPGPEVTVSKPANTLRLAFLGDSTFLGASLAHKDTLPALVAQEVADAFPTCDVDQISISGPGYALSDIRIILAEVQPETTPDAFVIMAGGMRQTLTAAEVEADPTESYFRTRNLAESYSLLLTKVRLAYVAVENARHAESEDLLKRLDLDLFEAAYVRKLADLASLIGDAPTVVIENRGRERDTMDDAAFAVLNRTLLADINGLGVSGLATLSRLMRDILGAQADANGWRYIDPLSNIPPTDRFFEDAVHLTSEGTHALAPAITEALIAQIETANLDLPCLQ